VKSKARKIEMVYIVNDFINYFFPEMETLFHSPGTLHFVCEKIFVTDLPCFIFSIMAQIESGKVMFHMCFSLPTLKFFWKGLIHVLSTYYVSDSVQGLRTHQWI
jgi:hypothetical protein